MTAKSLAALKAIMDLRIFERCSIRDENTGVYCDDYAVCMYPAPRSSYHYQYTYKLCVKHAKEATDCGISETKLIRLSHADAMELALDAIRCGESDG